VRTQRFSRSAGDAPSLGRVARVPGTGLPKELKQRRKRRGGSVHNELTKESRHRRNVVIAWSVLLVLAVLGVLGLFFLSWLKPQMKQGPVMAEEAAETIQKRNVSAFDSPTEGVALELVKQALAVRDPAEVELYFRIGSSEPAAAVAFLEGMGAADGEVTGYQWLSSMDANGLLIDGVLVNTSKDGSPRNRLALLTPNENGAWKIDFEAFARTVSPPWEELLAEGGDGRGMVRVIVARDSYYNGPFKDDKEWDSYGMASPDSDAILLGYCRKGSPQARAMERIFSEEKNAMNRRLNRATLELKRPEGAELRQFEIRRVLAEDWVLSGEPFDAAFE